MSKPVKHKKKGRSFSVTSTEIDLIDDRAATHHGFRNRSEYLLALVEADLFYGLVRDVEKLRLPPGRSGLQAELDDRRKYPEWQDPPETPDVNEPASLPDAIAAEEQRKRASRDGGARRRGSERARDPKT